MKIMLYLFVFLLACPIYFSAADAGNISDEARELERGQDYAKAAKKYYQHYKKTQNEMSLLACARLLPDYQDAVFKYREFIARHEKSSLYNLVLFELAELHKIYGKYDLALNTYTKLSKHAKGTLYYDKAMLNLALLNYKLGKYIESINILQYISGKIRDYYAASYINYLMGKNLFKQKLYNEAQKFFLVCAGNFPQSPRAASALLELGKIYKLRNKFVEAKRVTSLIKRLYPDSPEASQADYFLDMLRNVRDENTPEVEFIMLPRQYEINNEINDHIIVDIKRSREENRVSDNIKRYASYYIQLAYLSSEENAKIFVEGLLDKNVENVYYAKTASKSGKNVFYRVVIGPFNNKDAINKKVIELKENNIEAIILELEKVYE